jgi:hypothetical protein
LPEDAVLGFEHPVVFVGEKKELRGNATEASSGKGAFSLGVFNAEVLLSVNAEDGRIPTIYVEVGRGFEDLCTVLFTTLALLIDTIGHIDQCCGAATVEENAANVAEELLLRLEEANFFNGEVILHGDVASGGAVYDSELNVVGIIYGIVTLAELNETRVLAVPAPKILEFLSDIKYS